MLYLQDKTFSFDELKSLPDEEIDLFDSAQVKTALRFCKRWLNGETNFVFHTSGSTGTPKAIAITRQQMEASAQATINALQLTQKEHIYICLSTAVIGGAMMLVRSLILASHITITEPSSNPLALVPEQHPYTFVSFVPLQLGSLLQEDAETTAKLKRFTHILLGGAPINKTLNEKLKESGAQVWHTYGMTETVSHIALKKLNEPYFTALPGISIQTDQRGCLMILGAATNNQWVVTNDMAVIKDKNRFEVIGRADDVINSGGIKFFTAQIEEAIQRVCPASVFFVAGIPDPVLGEQIIAVFETSVPDEQILHKIKKQLSDLISPHAVPKQFFALKNLERTPSGKINKASSLRLLLN